ncbi:DMSO/TMAO reductase YedYZ molybdopterin-dependent catalytic subunit [Streptomyces sp. V2I9]|nr:DMSO/TMAO reductase YedYZ molybdopterin-dependent catalytic subunit [Streptomyces sp. V2I9]
MRTVRIERTALTRNALAALSGLLAGFAALAVAELVSAAVRPEAGPLTAVGGAAIDRTPVQVKDWAIRTFGENDKAVLQLGIVATLALLAVAIGLLALRHRRTGSLAVLVFGVVGTAAAVSRPDSTGLVDGLPSLVGAVAGAVLLYVLAGRLTTPRRGPTGSPDEESGWDRRGFLVAATAAAAASTAAGAVGRTLNGRSARDAVASRDAVRLPAPASPAEPIPAGARPRVPGLAPFTTPGKTFYRVDTALVVPKVDATTWRLRIHGKGVRRDLEFTYQDLLSRPLIEREITLCCVSNEVGGPYIGHARWIGVRLAGLLKEAGVKPPSRGGRADQIIARSVDGMTLGTPVEDVMDGRDALLALGMNGEPLPFVHGFPVRMLVPGLYGYVSACKWIEDIELTTFAAYDAYWVKRSWGAGGPRQDPVPHRHPQALRPPGGRYGHGRRSGLGPVPGHREGRDPGGRRPLAAGATGRPGHRRHLASVVLPVEGGPRQPHAHRPRHGRDGRDTDREAHRDRPGRGERMALRGRHRRLIRDAPDAGYAPHRTHSPGGTHGRHLVPAQLPCGGGEIGRRAVGRAAAPPERYLTAPAQQVEESLRVRGEVPGGTAGVRGPVARPGRHTVAARRPGRLRLPRGGQPSAGAGGRVIAHRIVPVRAFPAGRTQISSTPGTRGSRSCFLAHGGSVDTALAASTAYGGRAGQGSGGRDRMKRAASSASRAARSSGR